MMSRPQWPNAYATVKKPVIMTGASEVGCGYHGLKGHDPAMKLVLTSYGGRGDIEPAVVVGRELLRRGHDVRMVVPPNLVGFAEAAGLPAVAYGLDSQAILDLQREYFTLYSRAPWKLKELNRMARETERFAAYTHFSFTIRLSHRYRHSLRFTTKPLSP